MEEIEEERGMNAAGKGKSVLTSSRLRSYIAKVEVNINAASHLSRREIFHQWR